MLRTNGAKKSILFAQILDLFELTRAEFAHLYKT